MLRALLEERFRLETHSEKRPFPVYELQLGPTGPKFREVAAADDLQRPLADLSGSPAIYDVTNGLPGDQIRSIQVADGGGLYTITSRTAYVTRVVSPEGVRQLDASRIAMSEFIGELAPSVDRPIIDKTGLGGIYEIKTRLPPPRMSPALQAILRDRSVDPTGVSMALVLDELGLKLEAKETPMDFIVVDRIERPSSD